MQAYCMKCRNKTEMKNIMVVAFKNGRMATKGLCSTCNTKMYRIMKKETNENLVLCVETPKAIIPMVIYL